MPEKDPKLETLRQQGTLNLRTRAVTDALFVRGGFFEARDLVQIKYEMLRRVQAEGESITDAAAAFGFSRPSFYQAQVSFEQGGLGGLVPRKRGPKQAHKLTQEILIFISESRQKDPSIRTTELVRMIHERFGVTVHPRSIERSLLRAIKKNAAERRRCRTFGPTRSGHALRAASSRSHKSFTAPLRAVRAGARRRRRAN